MSKFCKKCGQVKQMLFAHTQLDTSTWYGIRLSYGYELLHKLGYNNIADTQSVYHYNTLQSNFKNNVAVWLEPNTEKICHLTRKRTYPPGKLSGWSWTTSLQFMNSVIKRIFNCQIKRIGRTRNGSHFRFEQLEPFVCLKCLNNVKPRKCLPPRNVHPAYQNPYKDDLSRLLFRKLKNAQIRAMKKNWDFDIDMPFLLNLYHKQNKKCAISHQPMTFLKNTPRDNTCGRIVFPHHISIDRIDSKQGYIKTNVQLTKVIHNIMKRDMNGQDFSKHCCVVAEVKNDQPVNEITEMLENLRI